MNAYWLRLFATCLVLLISNVGRTQIFAPLTPKGPEDTVHFREQIDILPDSTRFAYELGGLGLISKDGMTFIRMEGEKVAGQFLNSEPFRITSEFDSLRIVRWINFSKGFPDVFEGDENAPGFEQWIMSELGKVSGPTRPSLSVFNSRSSVLYIIELRRAEDKTLIASLDTVTAFLSFINGGMKWKHKLAGASCSVVPIAQYADSRVYVTMRREDHLPEGVKFVANSEFTVFERQGPLLDWGSTGCMGQFASDE